MSKDIGYVQPREIVQEMQQSYLDYAMSVIVARALPDVRDGLKPVHRRLLFAMYKMGLLPKAKFRKSATVVGEAMGKYHPHGDLALYAALARMAQKFSLRYPLVWGQGNWGSIDGDPPAAMRYTEAKMTAMAESLLQDIEKETVAWQPNYDDSRQEPKVLPAAVPQLLLNGSFGIAVGMASNIPPHNLTELVQALVCLIDKPDTSTEELVEIVPGPDFPTGGSIYDQKAILQAYGTGKGGIVVRGKAKIVQSKKNRFSIIISEVPYGVNKANLVTKIANLVRDKKLLGIRALRDESDKQGIRVVIELKSEAVPQKILNQLFKLTELQQVFHLNMLALVDGIQPQVLSLKAILTYYLKHREQVITRRLQFDLQAAKARAHILEGLKKALDQIDAIIALIKASSTKEKAHQNLKVKFKFSDAQATAILEMRLQALAGLEQKKIEQELMEKKALIIKLAAILASRPKLLAVVKKELIKIQERFGDERRTKVFKGPVGILAEEDLIANEPCLLIMTQAGYIKRMSPKTYQAQKRGGKGIRGLSPKAGDQVQGFLGANLHDEIFFFTNLGRVFKVKAYQIVEASRQSKGHSLVNFLQLSAQERVTAFLPIAKQTKASFLAMVTKNGIIKKIKIADLNNLRRNGMLAISLHKHDRLHFVGLSSGQAEIILFSSQGQAIRFAEKDVRAMGRTAAGVKALRLAKDDRVQAMQILEPADMSEASQTLIVTEKGFGKRTRLSLFKQQKRGGKGIRAVKITAKNGQLITAKLLSPEIEDVALISTKGQVIRTKIQDISAQGRITQGVKTMSLAAQDRVASVICL